METEDTVGTHSGGKSIQKDGKLLMEVSYTQGSDELVMVEIGGVSVEVLIDSGASVNAITTEQFNSIMGSEKAKVFNVRTAGGKTLWAYAANSPLDIEAVFEASLWIDDSRVCDLEEFMVIKGAKRCLLSKNTSLKYRLLKVGLSVEINEILSMREDRFFPKFKLPPVSLVIDKSVPPRRSIYTCIPPGWVNEVRKRLEDQVEQGIIERVKPEMDKRHCSSMLAVPKGADNFRLVIDLRNPNKCIIREPHRMPTFDSVIAKLHGSTWFSTIDLKDAFHHVVLHENSRHLTNFWSGDECFRCVRLPFGLCNAPDLFQHAMEEILEGCVSVAIYLDDILVFAKTEEEHDDNLAVVMRRLKEHSVKLNYEKCKFKVQQCKFLGFDLSNSGYTVAEEKVRAIKNFRTPSNFSELRSFIGLLNFVDRYILKRAEKLVHLQEILRSKQFIWSKEADEEFTYMRDHALLKIKQLGFYDCSHVTELIVDASPVGLGAVLVQIDEKKIPRIIACASKALTQTETRYSQTQKEALAVVWGAERFRFFLHGIKFTIVTDSEANEYIYGEEFRLGRRSVSRAEAWALRLQSFDFVMAGIEGEKNIADVFSRLIKETQPSEPFKDFVFEHAMTIGFEETQPLSFEEIVECSKVDKEVIEIKKALMNEIWGNEIAKFKKLADDFSTLGGSLTYQDKFFVPKILRRKALDIAHRCHFGMNSMKKMLKSCLWWPQMWKDVEATVKNCTICVRVGKPKEPIPLRSRTLPSLPMQVIQVDFLSLPGCGSGKFFTAVDTYSRMLWCVELNKTDFAPTVRALNKIFAIWGRPDVIQSDNGPPFNSQRFTAYWEKGGIKHRTVYPYAPFMNGLIERQNEGIIKTVKCALDEKKSWRDALDEYLNIYNNERPQATSGVTPFELMAGRKYRGFFPSLAGLKNNLVIDGIVRARDEAAKLKSTRYADKVRHAKSSDIKTGDWVYVANKNKANKLSPTYMKTPFRVIERVGPGVIVRNDEGLEYSRWVSDVVKVPENSFDWNEFSDTSLEESNKQSDEIIDDPRSGTESDGVEQETSVPAMRRSSRIRNVPAKLDNFKLFNIFG